jgi:hypothetical protein
MAISVPVSEQPSSMQESTWRTNLETPAGGAGSIQFYRETVGLDASNNVVGKPQQNMQPVSRNFEDVNEETAELSSGNRITFAEVVEALSQFADDWSTADKEDGGGANPGEPAP